MLDLGKRRRLGSFGFGSAPVATDSLSDLIDCLLVLAVAESRGLSFRCKAEAKRSIHTSMATYLAFRQIASFLSLAIV